MRRTPNSVHSTKREA
uniref:Uncharacterized protein n=1 Tax=Anguilla anguilla TaxID=7936 RepID=A0A0E9VRR1_ANGAN